MGVKPATFQSGGQVSQHVIPGSYSRIDYVKSAAGLSSINNAVIMGDSRGGQPNTLLWFSSPSEAIATLRSGTLLDAVKHAFNCSPDYTPQKVAAFRVNPGVQAGYSLKKSTDAVITTKAWDWGLHGNQVKIKLEAGTTGKKVTIQFMSETAYVVDNIIRASLTIQYTGAEASCTCTINDTTLVTTTATHTQELSITFASFPTINDLVNYINDQAGYSCTINTSDGSQLSTNLDWVTASDIKSAPVILYSSVQALIEAIDKCPWIQTGITAYNVTTSGRVMPDNVSSWAYFTGGTDGAYTNTDWGVSLTALERENVQIVGCSSNSASVHALIKTHVASMNAVTGKNERQAILGGASSETAAQAIARAVAINSEADMLAYPEFQDFDANGNVVWWSPVYFAAKLIGLATCLPLQEPLTNKRISVLGVTTISQANQEALITGGVCVCQKNKVGDYVVVRSITTYQGDIIQKNEFSMVRSALFVSRDLRTAIETSFIGRAMTNAMLTDVDAVFIVKMNQYSSLGLFNGSPEYWGYRRSVNGDQIFIEFNANITPPANFIFITSHMQVFASTSA